jgi:hypothetical protein
VSLAVTENVTLTPAVTFWEVGCEVIVGGKFTASVALVLVTDP